jgi:hypothetical protein
VEILPVKDLEVREDMEDLAQKGALSLPDM